MCAEALTQEEIDALLRGEAPPPPASTLTPDDEDTLKHYSGLVAQSGEDVLSALLGERANLNPESYSETDINEIIGEIPENVVAAELSYKGMLQGKSVVFIPMDTAVRIAQQMTGGGSESEFGDLEESALSEAIQSHFSSVNTQLAQEIGGEIQIESPDITTRPSNLASVLPESVERPILLKYELQSGSASGTIYQVMPRNLLNSMVRAAAPGAAIKPEAQDTRRAYADAKAPPVMTSPAQFMPSYQEQAPAMPAGLNIDISNLELILDISLEIKVELGRTHRKIREVLELGPGSVIELDRLAGEPVDILVNNKLFAKGEVVVIDENFGVRITDILSIEERLEALK